MGIEAYKPTGEPVALFGSSSVPCLATLQRGGGREVVLEWHLPFPMVTSLARVLVSCNDGIHRARAYAQMRTWQGASGGMLLELAAMDGRGTPWDRPMQPGV